MAFSAYKNLATVIKEFQLHYEQADLEKITPVVAPTLLKEAIDFDLEELAYDSSEAIICETLIFPILREAWKPFRKELMLWSHQPMEAENGLSGTPDYLFAKQSELGKIVMDKPYIAIVEAKKDDFTGGWGKCAVEMYTAQQINQNADLKIFGIVSNGKTWEFGYLEKNTLVRYKDIVSINELNELYSIITHILTLCKNQIQHTV
ncbi:MAG: hypothetical protein H7Y04_04770 [Verrucomicrobia bacterium]|nr:hypothetical protein [Cytophagales bacterium]